MKRVFIFHPGFIQVNEILKTNFRLGENIASDSTMHTKPTSLIVREFASLGFHGRENSHLLVLCHPSNQHHNRQVSLSDRHSNAVS